MKITKTHVDKYLALRAEIKEREDAIKELRDRLVSSMKESGDETVETPSGSVKLVYRLVMVLNEDKVKEALGVGSLEDFKESRTVESLIVS